MDRTQQLVEPRSPEALSWINPPEFESRSSFADPDEVRMGRWISTWDRKEPLDVGIIGVPFARAAVRNVAADEAPNALRFARQFYTTYSIDYGLDAKDLRVRDVGDVRIPLLGVDEAHSAIYHAAVGVWGHRPTFTPVFIGGDHSVTRPIIKALCDAREDVERIGLVDFDAHTDSFSLEAEGPHNGTILTGLMEEDEVNLSGENICQIGITGFSFSESNYRWLADRGATIFTSRELARADMPEIISEAIRVASKGTDGIYVTFDIDCMDISCAPATGAPTPGGLQPWQAMDALFELGRLPNVLGLDLVEVDPRRDQQMTTVRLANKLLMTFLLGVSAREG